MCITRNPHQMLMTCLGLARTHCASFVASQQGSADPENTQTRPLHCCLSNLAYELKTMRWRTYLTYWPYSLQMARMIGMMTKVTTGRRQEAANMKKSTMAACVTLLSATFRLRHTWSDTVVVSAANLQVHVPTFCVLCKSTNSTPLLIGCATCVLCAHSREGRHNA